MQDGKKLKALLERFRNDECWNTLNPDGSHRFDKKVEWIGKMLREYAEALQIPVDDVVELAEGGRAYSWPNYYQKIVFPGVDSNGLVGVFRTFEDFRNISREKWAGFKCSRCGTISRHPQLCEHRLSKNGKCDWCSYGLFKSGVSVIILENGLAAIPIFEPVPKEDA